MKMEYTAMIRRGWPNEGAIDRAEVIKAGVTLVNGDWVEKQPDGTVAKTSATPTKYAGLVVAGNGDAASAANSGKAVVLWSGFLADISNFTAGTYAPGTELTVISGKLAVATPASGAGSTYVPGDAIIGAVLDVVAVGDFATAHITVLVK